ncbi:hypothetical protein QO218_20435 [Vibrio vulnificus]|uniref:hypothetical protein n=1 Tax=Vibrio vulnificus TaxID=672 RepID=UPI0024DFBA46|nr:hypothetical protein [Vibrio vulnificus]MDK2618084.1 hypothetical protein [Vibrio vulnificus]MDK2674888.1 hypothetical protein [Vibrio vulnificus]
MTKFDYAKFGLEREENEVHDYRKEFDPIQTPSELSSNIQEVIDRILSQCPDCDWQEDLLTFKVIEALRYVLSEYKLPNIESPFDGAKFDFEAYKLTGKAEQTHGDIAVIITRLFPDKTKPVSGVAFYEAKASGSHPYETCSFPAFCVQQLRRLVSNTPKLNYLFYNKQRRRYNSTRWPGAHEDKERNEMWGGYTGPQANAITVDANFLKQYRDVNSALSNVGECFGSHFVERVLSGRDLDYSRSVDETIRRWLKVTRRAPPLIISVSVYEDPTQSFSTQLELPGLEKVTFPEIGS